MASTYRLTTLAILVAAVLAVATGSAHAEETTPALHAFEVALPVELRELAGHGKPSPVTHAKVTIGVPEHATITRDTPVLVISATTDRGYNSSRRLLARYADVALASGWIIVAADASQDVAPEDDDVPLRVALNLAALAVLAQQWPEAGKAWLAFGGFSGGAKVSGWLAAAFAAQGRTVVGVYQAGINEDTLGPAAAQFRTANAFRQVPVFLQVGRDDEIATPAAHRDVAAHLKRAGFERVRIVSFAGRHEVDAGPLRDALGWFRESVAR